MGVGNSTLVSSIRKRDCHCKVVVYEIEGLDIHRREGIWDLDLPVQCIEMNCQLHFV